MNSSLLLSILLELAYFSLIVAEPPDPNTQAGIYDAFMCRNLFERYHVNRTLISRTTDFTLKLTSLQLAYPRREIDDQTTLYLDVHITKGDFDVTYTNQPLRHAHGRIHGYGTLESDSFDLSFTPTSVTLDPLDFYEMSVLPVQISGFPDDTPKAVLQAAHDAILSVMIEGANAKLNEAVDNYNYSRKR